MQSRLFSSVKIVYYKKYGVWGSKEAEGAVCESTVMLPEDAASVLYKAADRFAASLREVELYDLAFIVPLWKDINRCDVSNCPSADVLSFLGLKLSDFITSCNQQQLEVFKARFEATLLLSAALYHYPMENEQFTLRVSSYKELRFILASSMLTRDDIEARAAAEASKLTTSKQLLLTASILQLNEAKLLSKRCSDYALVYSQAWYYMDVIKRLTARVTAHIAASHPHDEQSDKREKKRQKQ